MALSRKSAEYRAELRSSSSVRFLSSLSSLSLLLWGSVTVLVWGWGAGRQTVLVTYMRDELGSCAPGSFTAVVLFYIYGAAAGPAVARCESHDSSAGNRDGPVILAPHRLHVTAPVLFDDRRSTRLFAHRHVHSACACTYKVVLFLLRTHASICFPGPSVSNTLRPYPILLIHSSFYLRFYSWVGIT